MKGIFAWVGFDSVGIPIPRTNARAAARTTRVAS